MQRASLQGPNVPNTLRHGEDMRVVAPRPGAPQERSVLDQAPAVFAGMEEVRKNKQLKSPPCYFELARKKGLDTEVVGQRGRRDLLRIYAQQTNLLADKCILNLSKSLGRTSFRKDGVIPTVGHGCLGCFAPSAAAYLNTSQLMCLTGFDPAEHVKVFDALETQRASDIDMLIGNAMNVPVVGVVAACALSMVDPS